jgi:integrase
VLKHHGQWKLEEGYERLPEPLSELGRALSPEEEVRLLDTARSRESWFVAYHATVVENETGMRGVEVRNLQLKRIHVGTREIHLQKSKTKGGVRTISLSADALDCEDMTCATTGSPGTVKLAPRNRCWKRRRVISRNGCPTSINTSGRRRLAKPRMNWHEFEPSRERPCERDWIRKTKKSFARTGLAMG